jgi:glycosyltransferase involved in cell wall biosynthesis
VTRESRESSVANSISVVVPVYNGARHLDAALASILDQGECLRELIVVDNASTDETARIISEYADDARLRTMRQESLVAPWRNWSDACELATGAFLKLVCADDRLLHGALRHQAAALVSNPSAAMVSSRRRVITDRGRKLASAIGNPTNLGLRRWSDVLRQTALSGGNELGEPACVMFRTERLQRALPWSDHWQYLIDLDMYDRVCADADVVLLEGVHAEFRLTNASWSEQLQDAQVAEFTAWVTERTGHAGLTADDLSTMERQAYARAKKRRRAYFAARQFDRVPDAIAHRCGLVISDR